jgi:hypothetical protein
MASDALPRDAEPAREPSDTSDGHLARGARSWRRRHEAFFVQSRHPAISVALSQTEREDRRTVPRQRPPQLGALDGMRCPTHSRGEDTSDSIGEITAIGL